MENKYYVTIQEDEFGFVVERIDETIEHIVSQ